MILLVLLLLEFTIIFILFEVYNVLMFLFLVNTH